MKFYFLIFLFSICAEVSFSQKSLEDNALSNAKEFTTIYNAGDYKKVTDYMIPTQYSNDSIGKRGFENHFKKMMSESTQKLEIISLLMFKIVNQQQQAIFQTTDKGNSGYIIGISDNRGSVWHYSQSLSTEAQFSFMLKIVPSLDYSFASLVDPDFGKRISFALNSIIQPFNFVDITGNILSSDKIKGKVIVLNFWSISCGPCIAEMPKLNAIVERMKHKNIVFIAPAFYSPKEIIVENFLPKHSFSYQIIEITNPHDYQILSYPTHIVIDKFKKVIYNASGATEENLLELERAINKAL